MCLLYLLIQSYFINLKVRGFVDCFVNAFYFNLSGHTILSSGPETLIVRFVQRLRLILIYNAIEKLLTLCQPHAGSHQASCRH